MLKLHISQSGLDPGFVKSNFVHHFYAVMQYQGELDIYDMQELLDAGLVQLTRDLPYEDIEWLWSECKRIDSDPKRVAMVGHCGSERFALFVNDLTGGAFAKMKEEV